jgi:Protein of unknown function (DUF3313)
MAASGPAYPVQEMMMLRDVFVRGLPRIHLATLRRRAMPTALLSTFALCLLASACASHAPMRSGLASSYATMPADEGHKGVLQAPLDAGCSGRYTRLRLEPVVYLDGVRDKLRAKIIALVETALIDNTRNALFRHFTETGIDTPETLRVRLVVTRITESSPLGNIASSMVLSPAFNGALAVEAELLDASTGRQCGLYLWADEGSVVNFKEFTGHFRRAGHPQKLAGYFAEAFAAYAAPLRAAPLLLPDLKNPVCP